MTSPIAPISPTAPALPSASSIDVSSVNSDTSRLSTRANLEKAGQQFEAVFTQMMMKAMRSTHLADDIFGSKAADTFRDMQDQKIAQSMAEHQPLGIGKAMVAFLAKSQPALQDPASSTAPSASPDPEGTTP